MVDKNPVEEIGLPYGLSAIFEDRSGTRCRRRDRETFCRRGRIRKAARHFAQAVADAEAAKVKAAGEVKGEFAALRGVL